MSNESIAQQTKVKITNPDRIVRILSRVATSGLVLQIRALKKPEVAVKGRAIVAGQGITSAEGFILSGISEKGKAHLLALTDGGFQIDFVLTNVKIVFYTNLLGLFGSGMRVSLPDFLWSVERRKDARFSVTASTRAYIRLDDLVIDQNDPSIPPFLGYQRDMATWQAIGDLSQGGISVVSRFPALCQILERGTVIKRSSLLLPLVPPVPVAFDVRWVKKVKESIQDLEGSQRTFRIYRFGLQFNNPSDVLVESVQRFMSKLLIADAI